MMTDLKAFLAFYKKIGIDLIPEARDDDAISYKIGNPRFRDDEINDSTKFDGYDGFYSDINFTKDGEFINQGFWE